MGCSDRFLGRSRTSGTQADKRDTSAHALVGLHRYAIAGGTFLPQTGLVPAASHLQVNWGRRRHSSAAVRTCAGSMGTSVPSRRQPWLTRMDWERCRHPSAAVRTCAWQHRGSIEGGLMFVPLRIGRLVVALWVFIMQQPTG